MDLVDVLEQINRSSLRFLEPLTPEATYKAIIDEAIKLVQADEGYLALADENNELSIKYAYIPFLKIAKMRKRGFTYTSFIQKKAYVIYAEDFKEFHPEFVEAGIQSTIFIPIINKNKCIGVMNIMSHHRLRKFSQRELSILKLFGSLASMAIQKAQLYAETKKALESRDFFISAAAHEIKTPVTTIFGYAQLLFDNIKKSKQLKTGWIDSLHAECYRLKFLINDFLETSRISTGRLHYNLKDCQLKTITDRVIYNFRFNYPDRKLILRNNLRTKNDIVIGDSDRLIQALNNLLDNAAKFSASDTIISMILRSNNSDFIITVKDQGKGIDKKDLPKIFERYFKGDGNQHEGLGLGLFLVKTIIEYHHGSTRLRSKLNNGTVAEIRLPRVKV